jgi:uncharacterized phage-associated protein
MISVVQVAAYICQRYQKEFQEQIDEMKLHKLLYFTQRECLVQKGESLFPEALHAWKYGPVMPEIRQLYKDDMLKDVPSDEVMAPYREVMDAVFQKYAGKDSWSLSRLSHGEQSWQNARKGLLATENGHQTMNVADIRKDAERIKQRRWILGQFRTLL